jgi:hypothetical protein
MTDTPLHQRFLAALRLPPTAIPDRWHHNTQQPDPGAGSYAYDALGLAFYTAIGAGTANRDAYIYEAPFEVEPFRTVTTGLGGIVMGTDLTTALLVSQADAVQRHMMAAPGSAPANGT